MNKMKIAKVLIYILIMSLLCLSSCNLPVGTDMLMNGEPEEEEEAAPKTHELSLTVEYEGNIIFDKYDVDVYVGDEQVGSISQDDTLTKSIKLEEGTYELCFYKEDDQDVYGKTTITMDDSRFFSCSIKAHKDEIDISSVSDESYTSYNKRLEEEEAKRKAEEERKAAEAKAAEEAELMKEQFEEDINDCVRKTVSEGEELADEYDYTMRLFNLDRDDITDKFDRFDEEKQDKYRIYQVGKINHDAKRVNLLVAPVNGLESKEKHHFASYKEEPLTTVYNEAEEEGYTVHVKDRNGNRIDNKEGFKLKDYLFMAVNKVNYDKSKIVFTADTKSHVAEVKAEKARKAAEAEKKKKEEAERKKKEQAAKAQSSRDNETVIITRTGECYHYSWCRTLRSRIPITRGEARARGYRPCQICNPD